MTEKKRPPGRPAANPVQTEAEMIESVATAKRDKPKLYKVQADEHRADVLSALVRRNAEQLIASEVEGVISLADTAAVRAKTMEYLSACEKAGAFPSILGLARALGHSRVALYECMDTRRYPETASWLEKCRDCFTDIVNESALTNNCNSVVAIFLGKALGNLRETVEIVARPAEPLGATPQDVSNIANKYAASLPAMGEDD